MKVAALVTLCMFWSAQVGSGQIVNTGRCPRVEVLKGFVLEQHLGTWYQFASCGTELFQGQGRCQAAHYSHNSTTGKVNVRNTQIPKKGFLPSQSSIKGTLEFADPKSNEAKFLVTFPAPVLQSITAPLWVLATDYECFSVVYSCVDFAVVHAVSGWILTRVRDMENSGRCWRKMEAEVPRILAKTGLKRSMFKNTDQTHCS